MAMQYCPYTNSSPPMCFYYKAIPKQLLQQIIKLCADCGAAHDGWVSPPCMRGGKEEHPEPCPELLELLRKHGFRVEG